MKATKGSDHRTVSFVARTAKVVERVLREMFERKIDYVLGADQFGFRRGRRKRGNWDAEYNIRTNFAHRPGILCVLHRLAESI
jgi:hypothetical protein